jgi:hypothetical protein
MAYTLENGVSAESTGDFSHALDACLSAFADHIGGAELARERNAIRMSTQHDDALSAEAACRDDTAQAHSTIADDCGNLARTNLGRERSMVTRSHHI